ncbi:MAG: RNA polymerase sigma factor [Deltaproteobacteria bacterium]|nr:RNA polymerase sigma factor [Deltaproteobacteria bacterium]
MLIQTTSDEELMLSFQRGEVKSFEELYLRHKKPVYNYIVRYTNSPDESEEVFQEVFIKLHRAAPSYVPTAKFTTWLYTIVRNLCIDHHRKKIIRPTISMDETYEDGSTSLRDRLASEDPAQDALNSDLEISKILEEALTHINEDQREVFLLREKSGLKFEEIAETLNVSVNTVKSRMRYALESLRKYLEKSGLKELNPKNNR